MNGTFRLGIELGNEAMQSPADVGRALEKVAAALVTAGWDGIESGNVRDENGNTVGSWDVEIDTTPDDDHEGYCRRHGSYHAAGYHSCPACADEKGEPDPAREEERPREVPMPGDTY